VLFHQRAEDLMVCALFQSMVYRVIQRTENTVLVFRSWFLLILGPFVSEPTRLLVSIPKVVRVEAREEKYDYSRTDQLHQL
jgi:hypothetical protein